MYQDRKSLEIDEKILYYILRPDCQEEEEEADLNLQKSLSQFELIEEKITSHDEYDGGAYYESIIEDKINNRFYKCRYNDWNLNAQDSIGPYDEDGVTLESAYEVFPTEIITIKYE